MILKKWKGKLAVVLSMCLLATVNTVSMPLAPSVNAATTVTINAASKKQIIRGFGASSAWCGALSDSVMNALYSDIGLSILRVRLDPNEGWNTGNYNNWRDELSNAKKAKARGALVFATPWTAPASMKTNNSTKGTGTASLKTSSYADYAKYLKTAANYFADNGAPLYAISVQNEPDWSCDYDGCRWTAEQLHTFVKAYGSTVTSATKLMMPESLGFNQAMSDPTLNDASAEQYVSIIGGHLYGARIQDYPLARAKGKEIWETEHYTDDLSTKGSIDLAKEVNDCMVIGNMNAYTYWWINDPGNGLLNSARQPLQRAYALGQFAKFIRNGYYRVDATATPQSNVSVSAYTGDNKVVIVAINQGNSAVNQTFHVDNAAVSNVSRWTTGNNANMAKGSDITVSNGSFTAQLPAQSVTTYVGEIGEVVVTPTPSKVPTPTPSNPVPSNKLKLDYQVNNWGSGYQVSFKVTNDTDAKVDTWTLKLKKSEIKIDSSWNINVKESGDSYVITPVNWNSSIEKGNSIDFGVQGSGSIGTTLTYSLT